MTKIEEIKKEFGREYANTSSFTFSDYLKWLEIAYNEGKNDKVQ